MRGVGVEVDPLALMLDGAAVSRGGFRFNSENVECLEEGGPSLMATSLKLAQWAEVTEAILELEAWADWMLNDDSLPSAPKELSSLAADALSHSSARNKRGTVLCLLEAAALLRDGWRPRGLMAADLCENCGDAFDAPERPCPRPSPGIPYVHCGRGGHMFRAKERWFSAGGGIAKMGPFPSRRQARESMRLVTETEEQHASHVRHVELANALTAATYGRLIRAGVQIPARMPRARQTAKYPPDLRVWKEP